MKKIYILIVLIVCANAFAAQINGVSRYGTMVWGEDPWGDSNILKIGQVIPLENMKGEALSWEDINWEKTILPYPHVIKIDHAKTLITGDIGNFTIHWVFSDDKEFIREYKTGSTPAKAPVIVYYNEENNAPHPNIGSIPRPTFHFNSLVSEKPDDPQLINDNQKYISISKDLITAEGPRDITPTFIVLQCDDFNPDSEDDYLGIEIIQIKEYIPDVYLGKVHVGSRLFPSNRLYDKESGVYAYILSGEDDDNRLIYQHNVQNSPQFKDVWAIGENSNPARMEIIWMRKGISDVQWPYEYRQYTSQWPSDAPEKYQLYVRGNDDHPGTGVNIPSDLNSEWVTDQFVNPFHSSQLTTSTNGKLFTTNGGPGWALLKYKTGPVPGRFWIGFEVIRCVDHDDSTFFNLSPEDWDIGKEIVDSYHEGYTSPHFLPGYIYIASGDACDRCDRYAPGIYNQGNGGTGQIFAVNEGFLEVWWFNQSRIKDPEGSDFPDWPENLRVLWPSKVVRYNAVWPEDPKTIIIARQNGTGVIQKSQYGEDWDIYYQNDSTQPGFNPNEEHARKYGYKTGKAIFPLRNDLNGKETSEAYVLMKYKEQPDNHFWRFEVYKVYDEKKPYFFRDWEHLTAKVTITPEIFHQIQSDDIFKADPSDNITQTTIKKLVIKRLEQEIVKEFESVFSLKKTIQNILKSIPENITSTADPSEQAYSENDQTISENLSNTSDASSQDYSENNSNEKYYSLSEEDILPFQETVLKYTSERDPYEKFAGNPLIPPKPIDEFEYCKENKGISGPFFEDRKNNHWIIAAGDDGGSANIIMQYYYPVQPEYFFPDDSYHFGDNVPFLDKKTKTPVDINYTVHWTDKPKMKINQTLIERRDGLPEINGMQSVDIIYQQSIAQGGGESLTLIDPTQKHSVSLRAVHSDIMVENDGPYKMFPELSLALRCRLRYDPLYQKLIFFGEINEVTTGPDFALLNVMSVSEYQELWSLCADQSWRNAVDALYELSKKPVYISNSNTDTFENLALTSGFAKGCGYVTLIMQNKNDLGTLPVSIEIIKVIPELDPGKITVLYPQCPFDETVTIRHQSDFGGRPDDFIFEWRYVSDDEMAEESYENWLTYSGKNYNTNQITIKGANKLTLSDKKFICRYRYIGTEMIIQNQWSEWTKPKSVDGWIKRVIGDINAYTQRASGGGIDGAENNFFSYREDINTSVSMISQAGPRWEGSVPLICKNLYDYGLLEIYETVLKRGKDFSINDRPGCSSISNALQLVTSRISDLYILLANEAFDDALDPTVGFGTDDGIYGQEATSIHCFMNQTPNLLEEELALLRGRSKDYKTSPVYNRLYWNFTQGKGEVAYALNYNIVDENDDSAGHIDEADAKRMYPQGHGDAWGHYLTAIKVYYQLLTHPNFDWSARAEDISVGGKDLRVDYLDERKFAAAAASKARAGGEIVNLTFRKHFLENPEDQWKGFKDTDSEFAWGLSEWGSRSGQGAFLDWVVGNAILPPKDENPEHTGVDKIDRTTVLELRAVASNFVEIQSQVDMADNGLNPFGLAKNVIPFDIKPSEIDQGKTHFEQIYDRAVYFLNNTISVFNHAASVTQALRRQKDSLEKYKEQVVEKEYSFRNQLINIFGPPYPDDVGPNGTYESGYKGPDTWHFTYIDPSELVGDTNLSVITYPVSLTEVHINENGQFVKKIKDVIFHVSSSNDRFGLVKPPSWTSERPALGEIQIARSELILSRARFERALIEYDQLIDQIEDQVSLLETKKHLNDDEIMILKAQSAEQISLNSKIKASRQKQIDYRAKASLATHIANSVAEFLPKMAVFGFSTGGDFTSGIRGVIRKAGALLAEKYNIDANNESIDELGYQHDLQNIQIDSNITLNTNRQDYDIQQQIKQIEQIMRQEVSKRIELNTLQEVLHQASGKYLSVMARGQRLLEERDRFRAQTAENIQARRYKDMAFRIFRNEALQKYRAQFDTAARYVYLAAKAYDFETTLLSSDTNSGKVFLTDIIRKRLIGLISNGIPQTGTGLADPLRRMADNFKVFKDQSGFNSPQKETNRFSLRTELFRIQSGYGGNEIWRKTLHNHVVSNLLDIPEIQQYVRMFVPTLDAEPGIVIPFETTIHNGKNYFGWPLDGNHSTYNSTNFSTKIRSTGVWFSNYNNLTMSNTPFVYLIPVGNDIMRSPTYSSGKPRIFKVCDQKIPLPSSIGDADLSDYDWNPISNTVEDFAKIRKYSSFRAYHDSGQFDIKEVHRDSRLIGRSVWNSRWLLIIPAVSFLEDRDEGLLRFIDGKIQGDQRDGNGVSDIKLFFETYSISGNKK
jgi:hypothetical protein